MDIAAFCRQSRVLVVAGKGGVGKTTITAALARMAARAGLDVLVVELEGKPGMATAFGRSGSLGYDESTLSSVRSGRDGRTGGEGRTGRGGRTTRDGRTGTDGTDRTDRTDRTDGAFDHHGTDDTDDTGDPGDLEEREEREDREEESGGGRRVQARRITPDDALLEYLADHGMGRISKRLVSSGALDVVATAIPGIRDILVLGKIKQLERESGVDLILVDAPATGHAMTFLSSAQGLLDAARSGPVRAQAQDVVELLTDPERCQVALVTLPEEMPVNEVIEAAYQLEDKVGLTLGPVIVNACLADEPWLEEDPGRAAGEVGVELSEEQIGALGEAARFRSSRFRLQTEQRKRLAEELPLHQLVAPFVFSEGIGVGEIEEIAGALAKEVEAYGAEPRARAGGGGGGS